MNKKGFTLLETIIVLTVIGIIALSATPLFKNSNDSVSRATTIAQINSAIDMAQSNSKTKLTKTKLKFGEDKIEIISMKDNVGVYIEDYKIDEMNYDLNVKNNNVSELIFDLKGFPEEYKEYNFTGKVFKLKIEIYTNGLVKIEDI